MFHEGYYMYGTDEKTELGLSKQKCFPLEPCHCSSTLEMIYSKQRIQLSPREVKWLA